MTTLCITGMYKNMLKNCTRHNIYNNEGKNRKEKKMNGPKENKIERQLQNKERHNEVNNAQENKAAG